jgi:hypothetical protein
MVKLRWLFPAPFGMATPAVLAQGFLVFVILFMARKTLLAQFFTVWVSGMAILTYSIAVLSPQGVLGIHVVVEGTALPLLGAMACFTLFAKLPFVALLVIILAMAGVAIARRFLVVVVLVAIHALGVRVLSRQ